MTPSITVMSHVDSPDNIRYFYFDRELQLTSADDTMSSESRRNFCFAEDEEQKVQTRGLQSSTIKEPLEAHFTMLVILNNNKIRKLLVFSKNKH